jgi:hypothetical protein
MSANSDIADTILYRTYYGLMLPDILHHNGFDATKANKDRLHEFHKKILGYDTIGGKSHEYVSHFLLSVCAYWATEKGIFVRTSRHQPFGIEDMKLKDVWHLL